MIARLKSISELLRGGSDQSVASRNAISAFTIRVAGAGLAYISQIILARWMGSFEYGIFAYIWVWLLVISGFSTLGLNTAVIRFIPEYTEKQDFERLRGVIIQSRLITFAVSLILMAISFSLLYLFRNHVENYYLLPGFLVLICLPAVAITDLHDSMARGYRWMSLALIPPFIFRPLLLLAIMALAFANGYPLTAVTAISAALISSWLTLVIQIIFLEPRLRAEASSGKHQKETKFWLKTAFPILLMEGFVLFLQNTDILVLSIYHPPNEVAVYFAALKSITLIAFIHFAVSNAVANRFSAYEARGDRASLTSFIRQSVKWTFWPSLAAALFLLLIGKFLLSLFGNEFVAGYPVMVIIAIGLVLRATLGPAENVLNMLGEQNICAVVLAVSAIVNIFLNFTLIPRYGLEGAATATSISLVVAAILFFVAIKLRLNINIFTAQDRSGDQIAEGQ